jgi:steroid delta-isomerase-like uncharacterized protein
MKNSKTTALYKAYNAHLADGVGELYAVDGVHEDVPVGRPKEGRTAIVEGLKQFFRWFPDAHWKVSAEIVDGDAIASSYELTGSLQSDFHGVSARGQRISLRGVHILRLQDGLILRSEDYWDAKAFENQINVFKKEMEA